MTSKSSRSARSELQSIAASNSVTITAPATTTTKRGARLRQGRQKRARSGLITTADPAYRRTARSMSRLASRSAIACRLSYWRLPRARPTSTFTRLRATYTRSGISV